MLSDNSCYKLNMKSAELRSSKNEPASQLRIVKLSKRARLPTKGSKGAAGFDLYSAYDYIVPAQGKAIIDTDIAVSVPDGTYGRIAPRSGLAANSHIGIGAGVIDADYTGPVKVVLFNHSQAPFELKEGDRIAQLICELIVFPEVIEVAQLDQTDRNWGAFGSTGRN